MLTRKGQGTIEYLVIIAIVVVIALVVVGLLLQVMGQGSGIPETSAKTAWRSAEPWAIVDWDQNTNYLTVVLKNNSYEALDIVSLGVGGKLEETDQTGIAPGATITRYVNLTCTANTKYDYRKADINVTFNSANIAGKMESGVSDIVGTCH